METYELSLTAYLWRLENGLILAESPSFPELSCAASSGRQAFNKLKRGTRKVAQHLPCDELVRRQSVGPIHTDQLRLPIEPPVRSPAWQTPVDVTFTIAVWSHGESGWVVWIPVLGIHVLGRTEREVRDLAVVHIKAAMARDTDLWSNVDGISLPRLAALQRTVRWRLALMRVDVPVHSPKLAVQIAEQDAQPKKSVLKQATTNLALELTPVTSGNEPIVALMASILTGRRPRSVLLVGPSGVGKTHALRVLVSRRHEFGLADFHFYSTSGARLVAGMSSFGMWQERCQALCKEAEKIRAIVHLGSLIELMEVGRCEGNSMGIASFLRPSLVRGALLAVAECTPEQLALAERMNPQVVQAFEVVDVSEPDSDSARKILWEFASDFPQAVVREADGKSRAIRLIDEHGLAVVDRLHRRYATYSATPGRPLRFLTNLLRDRLDRIQFHNHLTPSARVNTVPTAVNDSHEASTATSATTGTLTETDIIGALLRETGLPLFLLDDRIAFDADSTRMALTRRVVGQDTATDCVVSLLATIKAGLARPGRPLASLLFIGPTGVGKTELARTLAEYLFGDEDRLTRVDMSEFSDPISAQRLIGGSFGDEGVLTSRIREQPFSVVLLDEFEKADSLVFDLLLQVLGEGRLTDGGGRLADFTNSVIVLTSNLGAESYQHGAAGFLAGRAEIGDHFLEAVRQFVRPELFNRFDAIVPFRPLDTIDLRRIAELQVRRLRSRDGLLFREQGWETSPEVIDRLTERGFDPRYGARPLKRAIERELLAPLSQQMNSIRPEQSVSVKIALADDKVSVSVVPVVDPSGRSAQWTQVNSELMPAISSVTAIRRRTRRMIDGESVRAFRNELYRFETQLERERRRMLKRTALGKEWKPAPDYTSRLSRAAVLRQLIDDLSLLGSAVEELEDHALLGLLVDQMTRAFDPAEVTRLNVEWRRLATEIYLSQFPNPNKLTLAVFGEHLPTLIDLLMAYRHVAASNASQRLNLWEFSSVQQGAESKPVAYPNRTDATLWRRMIHNPLEYLNQIPAGAVGFAWEAIGRGLYPRMRGEAGIHRFLKGNNEWLCLVLVEDTNASSFLPPEGIARQGVIAKRTKRDRQRDYNLDELLMIGPIPGQRLCWRGSSFDQKLEEWIHTRFELDIESAIIGSNEPSAGGAAVPSRVRSSK